MMKIDLNRPISNPLPPTERPLRSTGGKIDAQRGADISNPNQSHTVAGVTAQFSTESRELGRLQGLVASTPEVRHSRIEGLRNSIDQGTYQVSPQSIAQAMLGQATAKAR
jgi:flagellar biosynthesis anti-sigma factor FlgM